MFYQLLNTDSYSYTVLSAQISIKLLLFAYAGTSIVAVLFGFFIWRRTKKLSSFYFFLVSLLYGLQSFFDLLTWTSDAQSIMFSWSVLNTFYLGLFVLSYWFLYAFIKNRDIPLWQQIATMSMLIPILVASVIDIYIDTFDTVNYVAFGSETITNYTVFFEKYLTFVEIFFLLIVTLFTFIEYRKASEVLDKKRIALVGTGVFSLLFMLYFSIFIGQIAERLGTYYTGTTYYYNFEVYGNFGMPILLAFLGYLIMKYQAFDLKPIKSVMLVIMLMLILFVSTFV